MKLLAVILIAQGCLGLVLLFIGTIVHTTTIGVFVGSRIENYTLIGIGALLWQITKMVERSKLNG